MARYSSRFGLALALAALPVVAAPPTPSPVPVEVTNADPIPVTVQTKAGPPVTHMGVAAAEHVAVFFFRRNDQACEEGQSIATRVLPDGETLSLLIVPAGKAFVLTDLNIGLSERRFFRGPRAGR